MRFDPPLAVLIGLCVVYCSNSDKEATSKYADTSSFCMGWAQAECSDAVVSTCLAPSRDACVTRRQTACMERVVTPAQQAGLTYDSSRAEGCIRAVENAYSDARITSEEEQVRREACDLVFSGSGTRGTSCDTNSDCQQGEGLRCVVHHGSAESDAGPVSGTCQVPVETAPGASCSTPEAECQPGYHCGISAHCVQDAQLGAPCDQLDPCDEGLECSPTDAGELRCKEKARIGDACTSDLDCASGYCVEGGRRCAEAYQLSQNEPFCMPLHQ